MILLLLLLYVFTILQGIYYYIQETDMCLGYNLWYIRCYFPYYYYYYYYYY